VKYYIKSQIYHASSFRNFTAIVADTLEHFKTLFEYITQICINLLFFWIIKLICGNSC